MDILSRWNKDEDRPFKRDHLGTRYSLGKRVGQVIACAYESDRSTPTTRRLRMFVIDPAASALEGNITVGEVPYEPLLPGPSGRLFEVDGSDGCGNHYIIADLDDHGALLGDGFAPSQSDPRFHAQMVYAVASMVHASFRRALGRQIGWPFAEGRDNVKLRIRPFASFCSNAWYDPRAGTLNFGYFRAPEKVEGRTLPCSIVYTSLSQDIVAHEMSHAMLDALRANFSLPTSNDMTGFHEGFADIVALFQHFQYPDALRTAIAECRGELRSSAYLHSLGVQFGHASGGKSPLRMATSDQKYEPGLEAHRMGELLLAAVFDAYVTVFDRKVATLRRLASQGTGVLPDGRLPDLLVDELARKAADLATQFLSILIRAVDYLPPVDVRLGEYLRAIITADTELVPNDPWRYREAMIDAFRKRGIYPRDVVSLNEGALLWSQSDYPLDAVKALSFREIWFGGDPGLPVSPGEQIAQACELGEYVTRTPDHLRAFGLVAQGDPLLDGDDVSLPAVESIRTLRRPGPDGRIVFDTVAEIVQVRSVKPRDGKPGYEIHGGATVILDSTGTPRYVIRKSVIAAGRSERRAEFLASAQGKRFWVERNNRYVPKEDMFLALCARNTCDGQ